MPRLLAPWLGTACVSKRAFPKVNTKRWRRSTTVQYKPTAACRILLLVPRFHRISRARRASAHAIHPAKGKIMKIESAVVFVTGANRGLGLEFAKQALERGARKVYAGARDP